MGMLLWAPIGEDWGLWGCVGENFMEIMIKKNMIRVRYSIA